MALCRTTRKSHALGDRGAGSFLSNSISASCNASSGQEHHWRANSTRDAPSSSTSVFSSVSVIRVTVRQQTGFTWMCPRLVCRWTVRQYVSTGQGGSFQNPEKMFPGLVRSALVRTKATRLVEPLDDRLSRLDERWDFGRAGSFNLICEHEFGSAFASRARDAARLPSAGKQILSNASISNALACHSQHPASSD